MLDIKWNELGFEYRPTKSNIRFNYTDGRWDDGQICTDVHIHLHMAATCIHYGQACFEGLKAFRCRDGKARVFRAGENARRLSRSSEYLLGPPIPEGLFLDAVKRVVRDNIDYLPPYGSGGALYIRPVLIGKTPRIGIAPSDSYELIVMVVPVGPYYKGGITPVNAMIMDQFDRTAPRGSGHVKVAGNYAVGLTPSRFAKDRGFPICLYLDAATHSFIEEFGTSNFIGIKGEDEYVTPDSPSILPSITNDSLIKLAGDSGMKVQRRAVAVSELEEFSEVGACGTAVVITPIHKLYLGDKEYIYGDGKTCGRVLQKLYDALTTIQSGDSPDPYGWMLEI